MVKIASTVYTKEEIELQDGKVVTLVPLPIARLRKFMSSWETISTLEDGDDGFDVFVDCCGIAIGKSFEGDFDNLEAEAGAERALSPEFQKYLEEVLDLDTIYKIIEVCAGIKLNDPDLVATLMASQQEDGQS